MGKEKPYTRREFFFFFFVIFDIKSFFFIIYKNCRITYCERTLENSALKIKYETLCNNYNAGGANNVDTLSKFIALPCSWIRRLYDNSSHEWNLILLSFIERSFGTSFEIHSKLLFRTNKTIFFQSFYRENGT